MKGADEFRGLIAAAVSRFVAQRMGDPPPVAELERFGSQLHALVAERGLPPPLGPDESGRPGGIPDDEGAQLIARAIAGCGDPWLGEVARQLVKACFYPEFKVCRDSFREVSRDGACRRQELERVRVRLSGSHCVDCPHWVALSPAAHAACLADEWRGDPAVLAAHRDVFLPEDFRALRRWLHAAARS